MSGLTIRMYFLEACRGHEIMGDENRRAYDDQMFHLTEKIGEMTSTCSALTSIVGETNERLDGLCKDCGPAKFIKEEKKTRKMMKGLFVTQVIIVGFAIFKEKILSVFGLK